ncbi:MAG: hypothetical protein R3E31_09310 [Chloroflexota bacterium]|nr:hypothetical protein [Anaerolineales bacterium]MCA9977810.1 hypothetical protein [Anaerolineales bacterium]
MGQFEEKYNDTLRSLELTLVRQYRQFENLTDWETGTAVNNLIRTYTAVSRRRATPTIKQDALTQLIYDRLQTTCAGWLGQGPLIDEAGQVVQLDDTHLAVSEIIDCLKRIRRSIDMWNKEGGNRGYFEFIDQFLP